MATKEYVIINEDDETVHFRSASSPERVVEDMAHEGTFDYFDSPINLLVFKRDDASEISVEKVSLWQVHS